MSGFPLLFGRWQQAELAALRAERRLSRQLDAYCEGWGQAPSVPEITAAQRLRTQARDQLRALQAELASQRDGARVL
ncbi:hypothetical protein RAMLITH_06450 [Ramlibacter sp. RBP-2]|uniref:Uncharacterized protein n=1 Tax=Ramlibacter lithotrophicus TaxID=2606681 RepID=A0A7X6DE19_9BURK|nr:hypothetical protein [Ramlibacter lithotrophicus]NKE65457.1 hypothetical protein [Ramlibacter lithotrophicus]